MTKTTNRLLAVLILIVYGMGSAGCATVASGKTQEVIIRSKPAGADILIDGVVGGTTPMITKLMRKKRHTIEITSPDNMKVTRATTRGFNWWYLGNLIIGGLIGLIVDPITGAMYNINPDTIYVNFNELEISPGAIEKN